MSKDKASEIRDARASVELFTQERPMIVSPGVHAAMVETGHFDDLMDRVRINQMLPVR